MKRFFLGALLAGALLLPRPALAESADPAAAPLLPQSDEAPVFADVTGSWCEDYVKTVCRTGLMRGRTAGVFDAVTPLTNAQITVITARLHSLLAGGDGTLPSPAAGEPWFQSAVDALRQAYSDGSIPLFLDQLYDEYDPIGPEEPCTRERFLLLLSAVVPPSALTAINDIPLVLDTDSADILAFYRAGILSGSDEYGTFRGASPLTRGAAAALLARLSDPGQRLRFSVKRLDLCRDVLGVSPDTAMLTVEGREIPAALFAPQLCLSLYQWQGNPQRALADAYTFWCSYAAPFHPLAQELGIALTEDEQTQCLAYASATAGLYAESAAYRQFRQEGAVLNRRMRDHFYQKDNKTGESQYHSLLAQRSKAMEAALSPTQALRELDLAAVYRRLMASPLYQ